MLGRLTHFYQQNRARMELTAQAMLGRQEVKDENDRVTGATWFAASKRRITTEKFGGVLLEGINSAISGITGRSSVGLQFVATWIKRAQKIETPFVRWGEFKKKSASLPGKQADCLIGEVWFWKSRWEMVEGGEELRLSRDFSIAHAFYQLGGGLALFTSIIGFAGVVGDFHRWVAQYIPEVGKIPLSDFIDRLKKVGGAFGPYGCSLATIGGLSAASCDYFYGAWEEARDPQTGRLEPGAQTTHESRVKYRQYAQAKAIGALKYALRLVNILVTPQLPTGAVRTWVGFGLKMASEGYCNFWQALQIEWELAGRALAPIQGAAGDGADGPDDDGGASPRPSRRPSKAEDTGFALITDARPGTPFSGDQGSPSAPRSTSPSLFSWLGTLLRWNSEESL